MTAATTTKPIARLPEDPEQYRMSIGEHLEELRKRLILALVGFAVILIACLYYGDEVVAWFCRPLLLTLKERGLPPWTVDRSLGGSFMVYLKVSIITAAAFSAPWGVYQMWMFVAAGLYPHERKWIMRYTPLSIVLLISGMLFVYFVVMPFTIRFFVDWTASMPIPDYSTSAIITPAVPPLEIPAYDGDPDYKVFPNDGKARLWYNNLEGKLNIVVGGVLRSVPFAPMSLVVPQYELSEYIDLVVMMLIMFGLAFQLPLVVAALLKIGIFEPAQLRSARRYVYFALLILAAAVTPGDVITATLAMMGPLIILYELGIILGERGLKTEPEDTVEGDR